MLLPWEPLRISQCCSLRRFVGGASKVYQSPQSKFGRKAQPLIWREAYGARDRGTLGLGLKHRDESEARSGLETGLRRAAEVPSNPAWVRGRQQHLLADSPARADNRRYRRACECRAPERRDGSCTCTVSPIVPTGTSSSTLRRMCAVPWPWFPPAPNRCRHPMALCRVCCR